MASCVDALEVDVSTSKTAPRRLAAEERRARAVRLRKAGATFSDIGRALGISRQAAHKLVLRVLEHMTKEAQEEANILRFIEAERLDALHLALWPRAIKGDCSATDKILRIMERRARLFGLDKPIKVASTDLDGEHLSALHVTQPLSDTERAARLSDILAKAQARKRALEQIRAAEGQIVPVTAVDCIGELRQQEVPDHKSVVSNVAMRKS